MAYRRYFPLIQQHARRILGDGARAQDVAQETFLRFLGARVEGGDAGAVRWLYRTSANLAIDALRAARRQVTAGELRPALAPEALEAGHALRVALGGLERRLSLEVLRAGVLTRADGLTQPELAAVLEVSERTVRRWLTTFDEAARALAEETP